MILTHKWQVIRPPCCHYGKRSPYSLVALWPVSGCFPMTYSVATVSAILAQFVRDVTYGIRTATQRKCGAADGRRRPRSTG
jgi:hypothetical protein